MMSISSQPTKRGRSKNIPSAGAWHDAGHCTYTEFARRLRTPLLAPIKQPPSELVIVRKQVRLSLGLLIRPAHLHGQYRPGAHCGSGHRRESAHKACEHFFRRGEKFVESTCQSNSVGDGDHSLVTVFKPELSFSTGTFFRPSAGAPEMHVALTRLTLPARTLRLSDARSARMLGVRRAGMSTDATPPTPQPEPMSERILTFMQRVSASNVCHTTPFRVITNSVRGPRRLW